MRNQARVRRSLAVATTAVALLAAAACGNSGGVGHKANADQATVAAGQDVTLTYWTWFPAEATLKKSIAAFEAANPHIKITLREFSNTDYQKELPLALNGGQALDVVGVQISAMTNTVRSQLRPVSEWQGDLPADWQSKVNSTMLDQTKKIAKDDVLYSIPMGSIGSAVVYANADELSKLGLSFPKTQAELAAAVAKVKAAHDGVTPVVFTGESWWQNEMFLTVADQIDPMLSDNLYTNKVAWNSPQIVQALTAYQDLYAKGTFDKGGLSLKEADADNQFNAGKAAFLIEGSWTSSVLSVGLPQSQRHHGRQRHRRTPAGRDSGWPRNRPHLRRRRPSHTEELEVRGAGGEIHPVHDDRRRRRDVGAGPCTDPVAFRLPDPVDCAHHVRGANRLRRAADGHQRGRFRARRVLHDVHLRRLGQRPTRPGSRQHYPADTGGQAAVGLDQRPVPGPVTSRVQHGAVGPGPWGLAPGGAGHPAVPAEPRPGQARDVARR